MSKDPYKTLGVGRKASQDEIKKAYRKLARELHPDRNPGDMQAEERFKDVQAAYDTLGDADKRKRYDRSAMFGGNTGSAGNAGGGFGGGDFGSFSDILSGIFDRDNGRGSQRSGSERSGATSAPGQDLESAVTISFEQAVSGTQVSLSVPTQSMCTTCRGTGAKPGTAPKTCPKCNGRGIENQGQGLFSISQPCSRCGGTGTIIESPCTVCNGTGTRKSVKTYKVNIPAGVREGSRVRLAGKGSAGRGGGPNGDLYVICHVTPSPIFERKGDNLEVEVPLTIPEAIRGADVEVPTLAGRKKLRVPAGTTHGTVQRLRGEGPPKLGPGNRRGDLRYRFVIDVPATLSAEQAKAVDQLSAAMDSNPRARLFS